MKSILDLIFLLFLSGLQANIVPPSPIFFLSLDNTSSLLSVGGADGLLSFFDLAAFSSTCLANFTIGTGDVVQVKWNPVFSDMVAAISKDNRLAVLKFSDVGQLISTQALLLRHSQPLMSFDWDPVSGSHVVVGTSTGYIEEYAFDFSGLPDPSYTSIGYDSNLTANWFVGCHVSFLYRANQTSTFAGCSEGILYALNAGSGSTNSSLNLSGSFSCVSLYRAAGTKIVALVAGTVYIINISSMRVDLSFPIIPVEAPLSSGLILSMDVFGDLEKLAVRTTEGIAVYDLSSIIQSGFNHSFTMSLSEMIESGASVSMSVVRQAQSDNDPYINVSSTLGYIEVTPCWNAKAQLDPLGNKSSVSCGPSPPVVAVEIFLPFSFSTLNGSFEMISLGDLPGSDCAGHQGPIVDWLGDQSNEWTFSEPDNSSSSIQTCSLVQDVPRSGAIVSVADCKTACESRPECNTVFVKISSDDPLNALQPDTARLVEICNFFTCPLPNIPPAPSYPEIEIWTRITPFLWNNVTGTFGGYVAFGTANEVIHGGCSTENGLILTNASTAVIVPERDFSESESVLRFQVSQYNAEPTIRIFNLQLQFMTRYVPYKQFIEVPNSPPGGYFVTSPDPAGAPTGPVVFSQDGSFIFTTSMNNSIISFSVE